MPEITGKEKCLSLMIGGSHSKQDAVAIHQSNFLVVANEGDGSAFHDGDAKLIGQQAHDRGMLHPGQALQVSAALRQRNKENIPANIAAEY